MGPRPESLVLQPGSAPLLPSDCTSCSWLSGQGPGATSLLPGNSVTSCPCRVSYFFRMYSQCIRMSEPLCCLPETVTTLIPQYKQKDTFALTSQALYKVGRTGILTHVQRG